MKLKTLLSKHFTLTLFVSLIFGANVIAQERTVSGVVKGASDGMPLPGVNVSIEGTTIGTITDFDGKYSLNIKDEKTSIIFSFIGYKSQTVVVGTQGTINVTLEDDLEELEEVIVVGYGVQKKSVVTGAIASVKSDEITETPITNASQALQGRTPGVLVTNTSGQPGAGIEIRVRGTGSNGDNSPLYVVDGMQVDNINFLNPNDIESMEVLKDAASSAIYGARGANGVVMITTKKGKEGKARITYDGYFGIQTAARTSDLMNAQQYMEFHNMGAANAGYDQPFSAADMANPRADTDWQDEAFGNAPIQSHNISTSGGSESSTYLMSFGYLGQDGIVAPDKSNYERFNFRLNGTHKLSKSLTAGANMTYVHEKQSGIQENNAFGGSIQNVLLHDPLTPVYETDPNRIAELETKNGAVKNSNGQYYAVSDQDLREIVNPLARFENTNDESFTNKLIGNVFLEYKPVNIEGLRFKTDFGIDQGSWSNRNYTPEAYYNPNNTVATSSVSQNMNNYMTWQWENVAMYDRTFNEKHQINGVLGMTMRQSTGIDMSGSRANLQLPGWHYGYLGNGADDNNQKSNGGAYDQRLLSYFGRVGYTYDNKYMLSATMRYDGSSNFGPNNKYGFFPSVQAGWVLSNEDFLSSSETINFLKLRAAWGQVGNDKIEAFGYMQAIAPTYAYPIGPDGNPQPGYGVDRAGNPDLKWETAQEFNFGLDAGFFQDMLTTNIDVYSRQRKDLLGYQPIPDYVGMQDPITNMGTVQNRGIEMALTYQNREGELKYSFTGNFAYNDNKVLDVNNEDGIIYGPTMFQTDGQLVMMEGESLPVYYGFKTDGVFQSQAQADAYNEMYGKNAVAGDIQYVDSNGDGVIDANDRTAIGSPVHNWSYGLTIKLEYKGFDFSMFWQGQAGGEMINAAMRPDLMTTQNYPTRYLDSWTPSNPNASMPRFTHNDTNKNYTWMNDMVHLEDASYLRLQNIQVGYNFSDKACEKIGVGRLRVYASGNNLVTISEYSGINPENGHGGVWSGYDLGSYPVAASYLVGLNVTF
ncbi:TonB-dependent receptor [Flammeovirga sp. SubArs3]|uniref:SusC/RagA family TonB-linked outer membrane protein n=1 Tax=Flammeovirga sp. SubArs3 TaxID=2995316 RepID=UPI00248ABF12|nr:TonB-dependent receptor [Flammeovirga sp. SubArs3]